MKLALIRLIVAIAAACIMTWVLAAANLHRMIDRSFVDRHLAICILLIILAVVAYLAVPLSIIGVILALPI